MQQAILTAQEIIREQNDDSIEAIDQRNDAYMKHRERMKPEINNLLWTFLPETVTLKQADVLACVILDMLDNPQKYLSVKSAL